MSDSVDPKYKIWKIGGNCRWERIVGEMKGSNNMLHKK